MMHKYAKRPNASRVAGRLLLAFLLALAPLPAISDGMPKTVAAGDHAATTSHEMPCHAVKSDRTQQDTCPHCAGEGLASPCHCCGYAAPAGLGIQAGTPSGHHSDRSPLRLAVNLPLPESPHNRLFRPPIFQH